MTNFVERYRNVEGRNKQQPIKRRPMPSRQYVLILENQYRDNNQTENESNQRRKPSHGRLWRGLIEVENRSCGHFENSILEAAKSVQLT